MQSFLEFVVRHLVDHPSEVTVLKVPLGDASGSVSRYELRVAQGDVGKVVGKHGQTIEAIRSLATASAGRYSQRVQIEIVEDGPQSASASELESESNGMSLDRDADPNS
jgi:predicted RNA-binding protein YlqC (UPF0109 family)